jgi:hypothetical protein
LPDDCTRQVFDYLNLHELAIVAATSRLYNKIKVEGTQLFVKALKRKIVSSTNYLASGGITPTDLDKAPYNGSGWFIKKCHFSMNNSSKTRLGRNQLYEYVHLNTEFDNDYTDDKISKQTVTYYLYIDDYG